METTEPKQCKCATCLCACDVIETEFDDLGGTSFLYKCRTCGKRILRRFSDGEWTQINLDEKEA